MNRRNFFSTILSAILGATVLRRLLGREEGGIGLRFIRSWNPSTGTQLDVIYGWSAVYSDWVCALSGGPKCRRLLHSERVFDPTRLPA